MRWNTSVQASNLSRTAFEKSRAVLSLREASRRCVQAGKPDRAVMWNGMLESRKQEILACAKALEFTLGVRTQ